MTNIEEKLKRLLAVRGMTIKGLAAEIDVSEQGLGKMLRNNSMKVETLAKISRAVEVDPSFWFNDETKVSSQIPSSISQVAHGTSSGNKQKVEIGRKMSGRQEVYGMGIDELYMKLVKCEGEREVLRTKLTGFEQLLAAKEEMIQMMRGRN